MRTESGVPLGSEEEPIETGTELQLVVAEARGLLAELDDTRPVDMTAMYYQTGFDELRIALVAVLDALCRSGGGAAWDEAIGPFRTVTGVADTLSWGVSRVEEAIRDGNMIALVVGSHKLLPAAQFDDAGSPPPGLRKVLDVLREALDDEECALWLASRLGAHGQSDTRYQALHDGRLESVLKSARDDLAGHSNDEV